MGSVTCCICNGTYSISSYSRLNRAAKSKLSICNIHTTELSVKKQEERTKRRENYLKNKKRIASRRRRSREKRAAGSHTEEEWQSLCNLHNNKCLNCKKELPLTRDHIRALARGGTHDISNIQPLCRKCNSCKGTKEIDYRGLKDNAEEDAHEATS